MVLFHTKNVSLNLESASKILIEETVSIQNISTKLLYIFCILYRQPESSEAFNLTPGPMVILPHPYQIPIRPASPRAP